MAKATRPPRIKKNGVKQSLSSDEKQSIKSLMQAMQPFDNIRHTMPLQYIRAFILVALEEGLGVKEYARRSGVSPSVMSRHLLDIGERDRYKKPGLGFVVQRQDPLDLRTHQYFLTDGGRALAKTIGAELQQS
jgi:DNA-binding MarR family transcriptional regulator